MRTAIVANTGRPGGAQTETTLRADLVGLGTRLGWVGAEDKEEPAIRVVIERLRDEGDGLLLIFDNAPDADAIRSYLPVRGGAHVLVTSNSHNWRGLAAPVAIRVWPKEVGADYLIARTGREDERQAAEALSEALGGLPLAHEQAAAYCERLEIPLEAYRRRFEDAPAELLNTERDAPADYRLTVAKAFALAIEEAAKLHPAAEPLIVHAALLAPEPIPLFLFAEAPEEFGESLASALASDGLDEAVAALRAFALVERETIPDERDPTITTETIRLHRLVRQVAAARRNAEAREEMRRALVRAVAVAFPQYVYDDPNTWPRARRLDALALGLVAGDASPPTGTELQAAALMGYLESYRDGALGNYAQAQPLAERALAIREKVLGPEHPETATSLNNLGILLKKQGDLAGARSLYERALAATEKALGPDHPDTANSLNNLANLLQEQGDLAGARPLLERALAICEKTLGTDHPHTSVCLNNLGIFLMERGDFAEAQPLLKRALVIREKVFGSDHPGTATSVNNLGSLLAKQGDLDGAQPLFERALAIREQVLGSEHPLTKISARNTANGLDALGRVDEATALRTRYDIEPDR